MLLQQQPSFACRTESLPMLPIGVRWKYTEESLIPVACETAHRFSLLHDADCVHPEWRQHPYVM
jgi:hypothetical protein